MCLRPRKWDCCRPFCKNWRGFNKPQSFDQSNRMAGSRGTRLLFEGLQKHHVVWNCLGGVSKVLIPLLALCGFFPLHHAVLVVVMPAVSTLSRPYVFCAWLHFTAPLPSNATWRLPSLCHISPVYLFAPCPPSSCCSLCCPLVSVSPFLPQGRRSFSDVFVIHLRSTTEEHSGPLEMLSGTHTCSAPSRPWIGRVGVTFTSLDWTSWYCAATYFQCVAY